MMPPARRVHQYTYADYVDLERDSPTKHEFLDGEIYAMAGGSEDHSALAAEVLRLLGNAIGTQPCRVHTTDLRIYVEAAGLATFPDGAEGWASRVAIAGGSAEVAAVGATLVVDEVCRGSAIA